MLTQLLISFVITKHKIKHILKNITLIYIMLHELVHMQTKFSFREHFVTDITINFLILLWINYMTNDSTDKKMGYRHHLHLFFLLWIRKCLAKLLLSVKALLHISQYFFIPLWIRMSWQITFITKPLLQTSQWYFVILLWINLWSDKLS